MDYKQAEPTPIPEDKIGDYNSPVRAEHADPKRWGAYTSTAQEVYETRSKLAEAAESGRTGDGSTFNLVALVREIAYLEQTQRLHGHALRAGPKEAVQRAASRLHDTRTVTPVDERVKGEAHACENFIKEEFAAAFGLPEEDFSSFEPSPLSVMRELT